MNSTTQNTLTERKLAAAHMRFAVPFLKLSAGVIWSRRFICRGTVFDFRVRICRGDRQPGDADGHLDHPGNIHGRDRTDRSEDRREERGRRGGGCGLRRRLIRPDGPCLNPADADCR